jgi:hypothetical protein
LKLLTFTLTKLKGEIKMKQNRVFTYEISHGPENEWFLMKGQYHCGDSFRVRIDRTSISASIFEQVSLVCACSDYNPECELCTLDDGPLCTFDSLEKVESFDEEEFEKALLFAAETAWVRFNEQGMEDYYPDGQEIWDW